MMSPIQYSSEPDRTAGCGASQFAPLNSQGQVDSRCRPAPASRALQLQRPMSAARLPLDQRTLLASRVSGSY
jgi:hypothetical protein